MSIAFICCGWMLLLTTPRAVLLLVCIGVGGCGCPISSRSWRCGTASHALMYSVPSLALAAEDMTSLMSWAMLSTAPLFAGSLVSDDMKKWPPEQLHSFGLLR